MNTIRKPIKDNQVTIEAEMKMYQLSKRDVNRMLIQQLEIIQEFWRK
jgi:hypothetical protein